MLAVAYVGMGRVRSVTGITFRDSIVKKKCCKAYDNVGTKDIFRAISIDVWILEFEYVKTICL